MTHTPLRMWGQGAVTLPKKWRDQFETKNFMATETSEGLLIKPLVEEGEVEYYEKGPHEFGLHFPKGIDAKRLLMLMNEAEKSIRRKDRSAGRKAIRSRKNA